MRPLSLRARLTVWYSLVLLVVLCGFGITVIWQQERIGLRRIDSQLAGDEVTLANVLRDELSENPNAHVATAEVQELMTAPGRAVAIFDPDGRLEAASWGGLRLPAEAPRAEQGTQVWTAQTPDGAWRVHVQPQKAGERTFVLLIAAPLAELVRERREAREAMLVGVPVAWLLAVVGGLWLASIGLQPITEMARRAATMPLSAMEDLGETERRDELGQLARAFNGLLARLRQALRTQRQFMADASHELRTPVSVIRSTADVMLTREHRDESEYRDALTVVSAQSRRVGRLVEDMLVLARADAGGYPLRRVSLYLNELAVESQRTVDVLARDRGVAVRVSPSSDIPFFGDEDLLRRMVVNLLQNAVQHTREDGVVTIEVSQNAMTAAIRVKDQGEGIAEGDRTRIFDRFVQLDAARRSAGVGLGLPIARWIAEAHGGHLDLEESGATGSTFRIELPLTDG